MRPTKNKTRQALFDILRPALAGKPFIDLFAGSGAVGIEALANGAAGCIFVEYADIPYKLLQKNIHTLRTDADRQHRQLPEIILKRTRVERFLQNFTPTSPVIVWADPPYRETRWRAHLTSELQISATSYLVLELPLTTAAPVPTGWSLQKHKRYGNSRIEILAKE